MTRAAFEIARSEDGKRAVFVDAENAEEIFKFVEKKRNKNKFRYIVRCILENTIPLGVYTNESTSKVRNVKAMKAFRGGDNPRIYCKEYTNNDQVRVVICCEYLAKKKTKGIEAEAERLIEKVSKYEYDTKDLKLIRDAEEVYRTAHAEIRRREGQSGSTDPSRWFLE